MTDIFPASLREGDLCVRTTNNGPDKAQQVDVGIACHLVTHTYELGEPPPQLGPSFVITIDLDPGQTKECRTNVIGYDRTKYWFGYTCMVDPKFNDPNPGNSKYSETIPFPPSMCNDLIDNFHDPSATRCVLEFARLMSQGTGATAAMVDSGLPA